MKHLTDNMEILAAYIGNTLADDEKQQVEAHLADCEECRKFFVLTNDLLREPEPPESEMITEAEAISIRNKIFKDKEKHIPTRNGKKDSGESGFQAKKKKKDCSPGIGILSDGLAHPILNCISTLHLLLSGPSLHLIWIIFIWSGKLMI